MSNDTIWLVIGFGGQGLFFGRWIVQWFRSEQERESTIPLSFWYLSLIGGLITLVYAIHRKDPVFITGQALGTLVYLRNLMLIYRTGQRPTDDPAAPIQAGGGPAKGAPPVPTPKT
jgi:lipid-A-disaccharide synthase-like uncharacterized protein